MTTLSPPATAADRLRQLADWLERHEVTDEELVAATTWGCSRGSDVQLHISAARRVWPGKKIAINDSGFGHFDDGGFRIAVQCLRCCVPREETL